MHLSHWATWNQLYCSTTNAYHMIFSTYMLQGNLSTFISKHNKIHSTYQKIKWTWPVWWQFYIFFTSEGNSWLEGWNVLAIFGSYNVLLCKTRPLRYILNLWTFFLFDYILQSHHTHHSQQTFFLSPKSFRLQLDLIINEMKSSINQDPFL